MSMPGGGFVGDITTNSASGDAYSGIGSFEAGFTGNSAINFNANPNSSLLSSPVSSHVVIGVAAVAAIFFLTRK